jgi:hypothetical protein
VIYLGAAIVGLIGLTLLVVRWGQHRSQQTRAAIFVSAILAVIVYYDVAAWSGRQRVIGYLRESPTSVTVLVDDKPIQNPAAVIAAVSQVEHYWAHHSHPTRRIHIDLRNADGRLALELGRDSGDPKEYWVFCPACAITGAKNEIGRITTPLFDEY